MQFGLIQKGHIIAKKERDFDKEDRINIKNTIEKTIIDYIENILNETKIGIDKVESIGVAVPGTLKNNVIIKAENLGLYNYPLVDILHGYFKKIKITINNDAKCAAMCEKVYGNLSQYDDAIFLCLGTGIGGAVFLDGKLLKANKYTGFELRTHSH